MKLVLDDGREIELSKETSERLQKEFVKPVYKGELFLGTYGQENDRLIIKVTEKVKRGINRANVNSFVSIDPDFNFHFSESRYYNCLTPDCDRNYKNIKPLFGD
jgi:hypothetical protein